MPAKAHQIAFHPDNRRLAVGYCNNSPVVSVYDAVRGSLVADLPVGPIDDQVIAWDARGERLAVAGSDPRIQVWDVAAKRKLATLEGHVQHVTVLSFHSDGDLLASYSWDGVLRLWDVVYDFAPDEAEERLEAWCAEGGDGIVGEWSRAELEEHVRDEHSTFTWLLEPMIRRTGFDIEEARHSEDGIFARFVLRAV